MGRGRLATAPRINQQKERLTEKRDPPINGSGPWIKKEMVCAFREAISFPLAARATGGSSLDLLIDLQATRNPRAYQGSWKYKKWVSPTSHKGRPRFIGRGSAFNQSINKIGICEKLVGPAFHTRRHRCASRPDGHQARPRIPAAANVVHPCLVGGRGRALHEGGKHTAPGQATVRLPIYQLTSPSTSPPWPSVHWYHV